jgi:putative inorganic carbon (HCO3(-)) transporter
MDTLSENRHYSFIKMLSLGILAAFPVVDYLLRQVVQLPVLSSLWDELLIAALLLLALPQMRGQWPGRNLARPILVFILVLFAYIFLDFSRLGVGLEGFRAVAEYMVVFFAGACLVRDRRTIDFLLVLAVTVAVLVAAYGLYQYLADIPMPGRWIDSAESLQTRAFSIIGSPNALGSYMALMIPVSLGQMLAAPNWPKRLGFLAAAGIMGICLLLTFSRGAWLALAGAFALVGIIYDRRILYIGIVGAVLLFLLVPSVSDRFVYMLSNEYWTKSSETGRIGRWLNAFDQMRYDPVFGVGLGQYGGAVAQRNFGTIYVDNYYAKTAAETGLVGLGLLLWLIVTALRRALSAWRSINKGPLQHIVLGLFAGCLAVVLHNAVENIFEIPFLNTYFWLMLGLIFAAAEGIAQTEPTAPTPEPVESPPDPAGLPGKPETDTTRTPQGGGPDAA